MTDTPDLSSAATQTEQLAATLGDLTSLSRSFGSALTSAFRGAALQGKGLDDVLRGIASRLASSAFEKAFQPLASSVTSGLGALFGLPGFAKGGVFNAGRVVPFARGGVISAPSYFPMAGGRTGLMGEAGPEAIMPLARGPDGRLGVASRGGATHVTVNITTPDVEGFRRSEAQVQTMLARAAGRGRRGL